ncbi:MAG TPA: hypothetical protein VLA46_09110 [Saprospiraceae bacterium]|nr:hypothetical protein [Saprospiraceae bacterium]
MEQNKPNIKPAPALPEALHPEIGNGVAWAGQLHEQLLRSPDPSKQLDPLLILDHLQLKEDLQPDDTTGAAHINLPSSPEATHEIETPDHANITKVNLGESSEQPVVDTNPDIPKARKKAKSRKEGKAKLEEHTDWMEDTQEEEKSPKAGKLVRKAAKSIKRQEKEQIKAQEMKSTQPDLELSPFTRWLKGFAGSDYVHPYEDDFAFGQGPGSGGEGISETFADLLASQGYKEQAIEMYIKLMEKYPEKSGFFAAKIEALQQ